MKKLITSREYSPSHLHNAELSLKTYFRFIDQKWDSKYTVENDESVQPRNFLTKEERAKIREGVLEYGSVPAYAALTPEKRQEWKRYLAARFTKKIDDVTQEDWDRANGYKYVTIVYTSLDAGLRPCEVGRARINWIDLENCALRIPVDQSSKNRENWTVGLREDTTEYLQLWLEERELYDKYQKTDRLWLTRHNNLYGTKSLKLLLENLREIAGIDRNLTWYTLRHSTGTYMAHEEGLAAAKSQLRHKRTEATMKYDNVTLDRRQNALDRIG